MPNSDPGYEWVLNVFDKYKDNKKVHIYNNLPRLEFINLLRHAKSLIGNSSLGIHEAGFIGLPAINIGNRQRGRLTDNNIQFVDADLSIIKDALDTAAFSEVYRSKIEKEKSIYGDGYMVKKTLDILLKLPNKHTLLSKKITY